jgi:hypothetical protein
MSGIKIPKKSQAKLDYGAFGEIIHFLPEQGEEQ